MDYKELGELGHVKQVQRGKEIALETWLQNPTLPYRKIAELAGISESTFRKYRKDENFMEEYHKRCGAMFNELEGIAVNTMKKLATGGDFKAAKYILDSKGYEGAQKVEIQNTEIKVSVEE